MSSVEMDFATSALLALQSYGFAELRYDTAQFEPYSSRNRPDLLFSPASGPNTGVFFLVELRMPLNNGRRLPNCEVLKERRFLLATEFGMGTWSYALATTRTIDNDYRLHLSASQIQVFDAVRSGEDLATRILRWSGVGVFQPQVFSQPFLLPLPTRETYSMPVAARTDSLKAEKETPALALMESERTPDEEIFRRIFGALVSSEDLSSGFSPLKEFFYRGDLGFFEDRVDFLRFLKDTVIEHRYTMSSAFKPENLRTWFRQFNGGQVRGSKL